MLPNVFLSNEFFDLGFFKTDSFFLSFLPTSFRFDERITVICKFGSENFIYNLDTGTVLDEDGSNRDILKPTEEFLEKVRYEMRTIKIPEMILEGNRRTLVKFPERRNKTF